MQTNCANHSGFDSGARKGHRYFLNGRGRKVCVNGCGQVTDASDNNSDVLDTSPGAYPAKVFLLSDGQCSTVCPAGQTFYHTTDTAADWAVEKRCTTGCTTDSTQKYTKVHSTGDNTVSTPVQCLSVCEAGQAYDEDSFYCTVLCDRNATNKYRKFGGSGANDRDICTDTCPSGRYYDTGSELRCTPQCPPLDFSGNLVTGKEDQHFLHSGTCKDACTYKADASATAQYTYSKTFNGTPKTYCTNACPPTDITSRNGGVAPAIGKEGFDHLNSDFFLKNLTDTQCVADCAAGEVFVPSNKAFGLSSAQYDPSFYATTPKTDRCQTTCPTNADTGKLAPSSIVPKITTGTDRVLLRDHCSASCQGSGYRYTNPNLGGGDTTKETCVNDCTTLPTARNYIHRTNVVTEKHFCQVSCPTGFTNII